MDTPVLAGMNSELPGRESPRDKPALLGELERDPLRMDSRQAIVRASSESSVKWAGEEVTVLAGGLAVLLEVATTVLGAIARSRSALFGTVTSD